MHTSWSSSLMLTASIESNGVYIILRHSQCGMHVHIYSCHGFNWYMLLTPKIVTFCKNVTTETLSKVMLLSGLGLSVWEAFHLLYPCIIHFQLHHLIPCMSVRKCDPCILKWSTLTTCIGYSFEVDHSVLLFPFLGDQKDLRDKIDWGSSFLHYYPSYQEFLYVLWCHGMILFW